MAHGQSSAKEVPSSAGKFRKRSPRCPLREACVTVRVRLHPKLKRTTRNRCDRSCVWSELTCDLGNARCSRKQFRIESVNDPVVSARVTIPQEAPLLSKLQNSESRLPTIYRFLSRPNDCETNV